MIVSFLKKLDPESVGSFALIGIAATVSQSGLMILPILVGAYVDYLGHSESVAGWVASSNLAGIAVMTLVVSLRIRHWALQPVALYGMSVMIAADLLTIYVRTLPLFIGLRLFSGLGAGAVAAAVAAAIARSSRPDKGYGIYIGIQFAYPAIALFALPPILPDIGYNGLMIILAAIGLLCLPFIPLLTNYRFDESAAEASFERGLLFRTPAVLSVLGLCIYGAANGAIWAYADRIGLDDGLSGEEVGYVLAVACAISVIGALIVVWFEDRFGRLRPLACGIACQVVAMVVLVNYRNPLGYTIAFTLFSTAWAFTWPYFLSIQADIDETGTVVVIGQFMNLVGNSLGPALAAFLVGGGAYISAIWMACGLFVLSFLVTSVIPRLQASD